MIVNKAAMLLMRYFQKRRKMLFSSLLKVY